MKFLDWKNAFFFIIGVCIGVLAVITIMVQLGHVEIFERSMKIVFSMSSGNGPHNMLWMMKIYIVFYLLAVIPVLFFYALINVDKEIKKFPHLKSCSYVICLLSFCLYVYFTPSVYTLLWGVFVLGCLLCMFKQQTHLGVFSIFALFMLVIEIYGSDSYGNHGSLPALLAAPIASMQLFDKRKFVYVFAFSLTICIQIIRTGNYQDSGPIYHKTETINNIEARGIHTSKRKADIINSTLDGIKPYVSVSDTLMCFPSAPMMNYLTHTRPAGGTCWIGVDGVFILPIKETPKILFNKTSFSGENWYQTYRIDNSFGFDINSFVTEHRYRKVYENDYFILFIPPIS